MCLLPSSETRYGKTSPPSTISGHKKEEERCMAPPKAPAPRLRLSTTPQTASQLAHYSATTTRPPLLSLSLSLHPNT